MAAQSRLALRSSHRSSLGLGELPATHDPSTDHDYPKPPKRRHDGSGFQSTPRSVKVYSRKPATRDVAAPASGQAVTQLPAKPPAPIAQPNLVVQQPPHGPAINNHVDERIANGPSHETQVPPLTTRKADKRSLRSHDGGSRFRSELALYFADYDEILTDEPKTQEFVTPSTRIYIVDEPSKTPTSTTVPSIAVTNGTDLKPLAFLSSEVAFSTNHQIHDTSKDDNLKLNGAERLDFSSTERHARHITEDPLTDQLYFKAHRRAERGEKSHRNRERESAQHEKFQLERILDELKGHSWLKTMGITGITDSEKKLYEPKRASLIQRVMALLDKFRAWKEEEKRRKVERERAYTTDDEEAEDEDTEIDQPDSPARYDGVNERNGTACRLDGSSKIRGIKHRESTSARTEPPANSRSAQRQHTNLLPLSPEKPFTSFYSKPHQRDVALSKHRRGRVRFAFGQQLPELEQRDFNLPSEMLTTKFIAANARSRRAARREGKDQ